MKTLIGVIDRHYHRRWLFLFFKKAGGCCTYGGHQVRRRGRPYPPFSRQERFWRLGRFRDRPMNAVCEQMQANANWWSGLGRHHPIPAGKKIDVICRRCRLPTSARK
jgi:hypothetical protein